MKNETPGINDYLLGTLEALSNEFYKAGLPLIIGGGFSLYLRSVFLAKRRSPRYPLLLSQRPTKDIDVFLTNEIIINPGKAESIKEILRNLGFSIKTEFFQYIKEIEIQGIPREIIIDLLAQPVSSQDLDKVVIKPPRIKPKGVERFHAFFHREAEVINFGLIAISENEPDSKRFNFTNIYLTSVMSFIILKLFAFSDRILDEKKDFGRHHAYDIFASILDMSENDWKSAAQQIEHQSNSQILSEAKLLIMQFFSAEDQLGIIRIRENVQFRSNRTNYNPVIPIFIADLKELFQI